MLYGIAIDPFPVCDQCIALVTVSLCSVPFLSVVAVSFNSQPVAAVAENTHEKGLNIVIVSIDDKFLADTFSLVSEKFPGQEFRKVGATFSPGVDYMDEIR